MKKGKRTHASGHRRLGGQGFTPYHEESGRTYSSEIQVEFKSGNQVPASLMDFIRSKWAHDAWSQASRAIPEGIQADPAICAERSGWMVLVTLLKEGRR